MSAGKLANLDSRIVYLAVFLSILVPLFRPLGLRVSVSKDTKGVFNMIDALQPDDAVIVSPSFSPSSEGEMYPQLEAVLRHIMSRGSQICFVNLNVEGSMYAEKAMSSLGPSYHYQYGSDYVILPFLPGQDTAIASLASDFCGTFPEDAYGNPVGEMKALGGVAAIQDFALLVDFNTGDTAIYYVQHAEPRGVKVVAGASGVTVPYLTPYLGTGQLAGLIGGLRGAAEYETAVGAPGQALAAMDAQSLSHAAILTLMAVGNGAHLWMKRQSTRLNGGESK